MGLNAISILIYWAEVLESLQVALIGAIFILGMSSFGLSLVAFLMEPDEESKNISNKSLKKTIARYAKISIALFIILGIFRIFVRLKRQYWLLLRLKLQKL